MCSSDLHPGEEVRPLDAGFVAFWDPVHDREVASRIVEPGGSPVALAWSPDGRTLAVANDNNVLRLYRAGSKYTPVGGNLSPLHAFVAYGKSAGSEVSFTAFLQVK